MRIFLTGATGFIGTALISELLNAGHQVLGLARSDEGAKALKAAGVEPHHGNIEDLGSLRSGVAKTDGVIHCGFNHDFSKFLQTCENDRLAIEAMGAELDGSNRPLLVTSGVGMGIAAPGELGMEDVLNLDHPNPRTASEQACVGLVERGVNVSVIRLPQVHDTRKQGLITYLIQFARQNGKAAYLGEGTNRLSAAHVGDVARLYRLAFEKAEAGSRYNAVAEQGIPIKHICEVIGRGLKVPVVSLSAEQAQAHFGWMAAFAGLDLPASAASTQRRLNWHPTGPGLIADLQQMDYASA